MIVCYHIFNDFELVSIFKEKNNIPIILLSGINKDISKTTITNADAILSKPYYGKQLINLIKEKLTQYYPEVC